MATIYEGQGMAFTLAGFTGKTKKITVPGWEKEEIDITTLSNAAYKTFVMATLKTVNDVVFSETEFDPSVNLVSIPETNISLTLTFPDAAGTLTLWVQLKNPDDVEFATDEQPVQDLNFKVTNVNGSGAETGPAFSA